MKYEHIIWDWNGTLIDDVHASIDAINAVAVHYGLNPVSPDYYKENFRFPVADFYVQIGFDFSKQDFCDVSKLFIDQYNSHRFQCSIFDGALETMKKIKFEGKTQSLLSASRKDFLEESLAKYALTEFLDEVSGLDNLFAESKVELGKKHILKIGAPKDKILMVGDTAHDLHTAKAMGVDCALMTGGHYAKKRLEKLGAPTFESFGELSDYIFG